MRQNALSLNEMARQPYGRTVVAFSVIFRPLAKIRGCVYCRSKMQIMADNRELEVKKMK